VEVEVVALIEDLAPDVWVVFPEQPDLPVLLGDEFLAHCGDLDEQVFVGEIEVGREEPGGHPVLPEFDGERLRLVEPFDSVEVEESGELPFALVSKFGVVRRGREVEVGPQGVMPPGSLKRPVLP